jgi:ankyrin repeat protein
MLVFGIELLTAGTTPLLRAASQADVPVLRRLLAHGADTNIPTKDQTTALMLAAGLGWKDVYSQASEADAIEFMKACLDRGADVNAANVQGDTALHGAAQRGSPSLVDFLVARGATLNLKNKQGRTPLDEALAYFPPREQAAVRLRDIMVKNSIPIELFKRTGPQCCGGCDCTKDLKRPDRGKDEAPKR